MFDWLKRLFERPRDGVVCEDGSSTDTPHTRPRYPADIDLAPIRNLAEHARAEIDQALGRELDRTIANAASLARQGQPLEQVMAEADDAIFWASVRTTAEKKIGAKISDNAWKDEAVREKWRQRLNMVK